MSSYTAFILSDQPREDLLKRFPPKYDKVSADHITHVCGAKDFGTLGHARNVKITGYVTDGNGCTGADTVMVEFKDCTGIGEIDGISSIRLYPNPGQGEFILQMNTKTRLALNINIYNNRGVKVYEEENIQIAGSETIRMDLSNQPSGIYLVNVYNSSGKWIEKLIIRK